MAFMAAVTPSGPRACGRRRVGLGYSPVKPSFPVTACVALFVVVGAWDARAQVSALGKGFLIDGAGSLTSDPNEVIAGRNSIKGSYSGAGEYKSGLDHNLVEGRAKGYALHAPNARVRR